MNNFNIKKRQTMSFDEFIKNKVGIEKSEHEIVAKAYDGEKKGDKGVETLDEKKEWHGIPISLDELKKMFDATALKDIEELDDYAGVSVDAKNGKEYDVRYQNGKYLIDANVDESKINEGWDTTLDKAFPSLTEMTLGMLKQNLKSKASKVKISPYENGREEGHHLSYDGNAVSFSENRNSDDVVVYYGKDEDFNESGTISEEKYRSNSKYFKIDTNPKDVAKFIIEKLGLNTVKEAYEMDIESGDMGYEHAKAVIDRAMENNKKSGNPDKWDISKAFKEICKENDIKNNDDRANIIADALLDLLDLMHNQAKNLV